MMGECFVHYAAVAKMGNYATCVGACCRWVYDNLNEEDGIHDDSYTDGVRVYRLLHCSFMTDYGMEGDCYVKVSRELTDDELREIANKGFVDLKGGDCDEQ